MRVETVTQSESSQSETVTQSNQGQLPDKLLQAVRDELHQALRKELGPALQKELPRALGSSGAAEYFAKPHFASETSRGAESGPDSDDAHEEQATQPALHRELGMNHFAARKYYEELHTHDHAHGKSVMFRPSAFRVSHTSTGGGASESLALEASCGSMEATDTNLILQRDLRRGQVQGQVDLRETGKKESRGRRSLLTRPSYVRKLGWFDLIQVYALSLADSTTFGLVTTAIIILNAIVIGVETDWMVATEDTPVGFTVVSVCFCVVFTMELLVRLTALRMRFFIEDWQWNIFDALLVGLQIAELSIEFIGGGAENSGLNVSSMRILRMLRLVRVMRAVRVVRYIRELRTIVASVFNSLKALMFTMVLIFLLIYILGVALTQIVTEHNRSEDAPGKEVLSEHFGSVPWSCMVLFQTITNGIDWTSVSTPLTVHVSWIMGPMMCLFIAFAQFAMLNVITGVFVEAAIESDNEEKDCTMVSRLMDFLSGCQTSGEIGWDEFEQRLNDPAIQLYFQSIDVDPCEARSLFLLLDSDSSGSISAEEFIMGCLRLRGSAKAIDLCTFMYENRCWSRHFEGLLMQLQKSIKSRTRPLSGKRGPPSKKASTASRAAAHAVGGVTATSTMNSCSPRPPTDDLGMELALPGPQQAQSEVVELPGSIQ